MKIGRIVSKIQTAVKYSYEHYDVEKNKCVGRNKHAGRIFWGILIIVQSLIRACRKEKSEKFNKRAARLFGTPEQLGKTIESHSLDDDSTLKKKWDLFSFNSS